MDIISKEILKNALRNYDGTVIVISHDREFLEDLVSVIYEFRDGQVRQFLGGIWEFIEKRKIDNLNEIERKNPDVKNNETKEIVASAVKAIENPAPVQVSATVVEEDKEEKEENKMSYADKKEHERKRTSLKSKAKKLEEEVSILEAKVAEIELKLSDPSQYTNDLLHEYELAKKKLDTTFEQWSEKTNQLENFA